MTEVIRLSEAALVNPKGPKPGEISADELCDFIPMASVREDGTMTVGEQRPYRQISKGYTPFRSGDVLLAKITPCFENGKIALATTSTEYAFGSTEFHVIRSRKDKLDSQYLLHFLRQMRIRIDGESKMTGSAGQKRVPRSFLEELVIPLPNRDEQRRIATILDKADAIRRTREQAIALAGDFLRSVFLEMFGDPLVNPNRFPKERIGNHLSKTRPGTQSGPFGSALKKDEYTESGVPVWGVENVHQNYFNGHARLFVSNEKYEDLKRYNVIDGDVLISRAGTVGRMCIAAPSREHSIISTNLVRVSLDHTTLLPEYFVCLFTFFADRLGALRANNKDAAFTFLNPKTLREIKIPIPGIEIQSRFVLATRSLKKLTIRQENQQQGILDLFSSLSQRAFRGEL
jgi:type I restriction enzyme S subunit